jgi:hypothetical protein
VPTSLTVLANSYKVGLRCLAAVNESNAWVRVVSNADGLGILPQRLLVGGRPVAPGDSIELDLGMALPLYFQSENVLLGTAPIALGRPLDILSLRAKLEDVASRVPGFAQTPRSAIEADEYGRMSSDSLALLRTDELRLVWRPNFKGVLRPRAIFMTEQGAWDIPYTGEQWEGFPERVAGSRQTYGASYVTVSVGDTIPDTKTHYVLAAGVLSVG